MATPKNKKKRPRRIPGVSPACSTAAHTLRVTTGKAPRSQRRRSLAGRRAHTACPPSGQGARRQGESRATIAARAKAARVRYWLGKGYSLATARRKAATPRKRSKR